MIGSIYHNILLEYNKTQYGLPNPSVFTKKVNMITQQSTPDGIYDKYEWSH